MKHRRDEKWRGCVMLAVGLCGMAYSGALPLLPAADAATAARPRIVPVAEEADVDLPEAVTFLNLTAEEMAKYHHQHGAYARKWHQLHFDYAYPTYRISDPDIWPLPKDKNRWHPRGSHYTYVIELADKQSFLVRALDSKGQATYELREGMTYPKPLAKSQPGNPPPK